MHGSLDSGNFRFWKNVWVSCFKFRKTMVFENSRICPGLIFQFPARHVFFVNPRFPRWRQRTNSQIQIQAPPNAPRDEILPQGKPSLSGWPRSMPWASRAMPGHMFACHALLLRAMVCHDHSVSGFFWKWPLDYF